MYFEQAGETYRDMSQREKDSLTDNITESLMFVDESIQKKIVEYLSEVDRGMGEQVRRGLGF